MKPNEEEEVTPESKVNPGPWSSDQVELNGVRMLTSACLSVFRSAVIRLTTAMQLSQVSSSNKRMLLVVRHDIHVTDRSVRFDCCAL